MPRDFATLRLGIDGAWSSAEFSRLFSEFEMLNEMAHFGLTRSDGETMLAFDYLPSRRVMRELYLDVQTEEHVLALAADAQIQNHIRYVSTPRPLQVIKLEFASPGIVDLLGVGKVIEEVRKFVVEIADRWIAAPDRELERDHKRQQILAEKIANAERLVNLSEKTGLDPEMRRQLVRRLLECDRFIEDKMIEGQITNVEQLPADDR
jgi:hypothetical protein